MADFKVANFSQYDFISYYLIVCCVVENDWNSDT